jgi:prepilin signal peptidase PulO-like enzyme (type II secretory pathway)
MPIVGQAFIFAFGAVIGSFLNAVLWRLHAKESFIFGRSHCPHCRHELAAVDLVPILSYLLLGGKCRYCRRTIDPAYLLIEVAAGTLFLLSALNLMTLAGGLDAAALARLLLQWYLLAVLIIVFVYDCRYMLILPSIALSAAAVAFAGNLALGQSWWSLLVGAVFGGGFFYLQYVLSGGRWIGGGDIYLGVLLGAMVGWPQVLLVLFLAYISGAVVGSALLLARKKTMQSQVPFGTFLSAAGAVVLLYGDQIAAWYLGLIL